jgi:hypothetical protein
MSDNFNKFHDPEIDLSFFCNVKWTANQWFPTYDFVYFFIRFGARVNNFQRGKKLLHAIKSDKKSKEN